jgi:hypothetical protein
MKKWSILISRYLLGIIFLFNGINMFAQFMPLPNPQQPDIAQRFLKRHLVSFQNGSANGSRCIGSWANASLSHLYK